MEQKDELFQLIKSLSGNEKRYFKLYSNLQKGDKTYLTLFDALDKLKTYDEQKFKQKNAKASYINNYTWRKHHLLNMILDALELYHRSVDSEIYSLLHRASILYNKSLYSQCKKTLARAKQIAKKHELFTALFEVLRMEEIVAGKLYDFSTQLACVNEMNNTIAVLQNQATYKSKFMKLYEQHLNFGFFRTPNDELKARNIIGKNILRDDDGPTSMSAKRQLYYMRFIYYFMKGDLKNQYINSKKNVETYLNNPLQIDNNTSGYINAMNAFLYCCTQTANYGEMAEYISRFYIYKKKFKNINHLAASLVIQSHEISYYNLTGQYNKGLSKTHELILDLDKYKNSLTDLEKIGMYVSVAMVYFTNDRYKESLYWLNKVLNEHQLKVRWDIESIVHIFYIIVHYEKGASRDFIKSLVKKTYRLLLKRKTLHRFEKIILDFIKNKLSKAKSEDEIVKQFTTLRKQLIAIKRDRMESRPLDYFNLINWLTSKIEGRKFADVR